MSAPWVMRSRAISSWPYFAARERAVWPSRLAECSGMRCRKRLRARSVHPYRAARRRRMSRRPVSLSCSVSELGSGLVATDVEFCLDVMLCI
ncbi:hypothetical protein BJX62DRAFT_208778 [Aspergillus germanicus]